MSVASLSFLQMSEAVTVLLAGYISAAIKCDWDLSQVQLAIFNAVGLFLPKIKRFRYNFRYKLFR